VADIDIQKKQGQPAWVWVAAVVAIVALAGVLWAVMANRDDADDARMHRDTVPAARDTPVGWLDPANATRPDVVLLG
jgi:multidrug resistance efflux pump